MMMALNQTLLHTSLIIKAPLACIYMHKSASTSVHIKVIPKISQFLYAL